MKLSHCFSFVILTSSFIIACNSHPTDADIQQNINNSFKKDLAGAALNATVDSGVVTVTGQCEGTNCTAIVVERVKKIKGVKNVQTHIIEK